jgi:hypothetical protein
MIRGNEQGNASQSNKASFIGKKLTGQSYVRTSLAGRMRGEADLRRGGELEWGQRRNRPALTKSHGGVVGGEMEGAGGG